MKSKRIGQEKCNNQGCLMKIVTYNNCDDIIVEFQDTYKTRIHTNYRSFSKGIAKNPYYPSVFGVGMIGAKYKISIDKKATKEYQAWRDMLVRCFDKKLKKEHHTYEDATCCEEWLLFENFYEWLHSQENFDKWLNGKKWSLDKDILIKGNKIYSSDTCCLVPHNVNCLFLKSDASRGNLPIGVTRKDDGFEARCENQLLGKRESIGTYNTSEKAFSAYKFYKESLIKQVAKIEYDAGNITKFCYDAMMNYEVDIDD